MTYRDLLYKAADLINNHKITLGEYMEMTKPLDREVEQEPKIKVLDHDEVARKLGTVDIYKASAWITLLKDLEFLGMKICEVKE